MKRGFLLRKLVAPSAQATDATELESNVAQLATAHGTKATEQESHVAQPVSDVLRHNASMLALMTHSEAVLCTCQGLDPQLARRCWVAAVQLLAYETIREHEALGMPTTSPPSTANYLRCLQDFKAQLDSLTLKLCDSRVKPAH